MSNPIAVITGAASGIGAAVKTSLEAQGYRTISIDLRDADIMADLSKPEGRRHAIEAALAMSEGKIDRLVLAAGLGGHVESGQLVARVNYFGAIELLDGFKDAVAEAEGRIVVIGSNSAQMRVDPEGDIVRCLLDGNEPGAMQYIGDAHGAIVYASSKHAVTRAVRRRANEFGKAGIRMNVIAPGPTETPMLQGVKDHEQLKHSLSAIPIPMERFGQIEEIVDVIDFLLSDKASYMHGSVIYVDGGSDAQVRSDAF